MASAESVGLENNVPGIIYHLGRCLSGNEDIADEVMMQRDAQVGSFDHETITTMPSQDNSIRDYDGLPSTNTDARFIIEDLLLLDEQLGLNEKARQSRKSRLSNKRGDPTQVDDKEYAATKIIELEGIKESNEGMLYSSPVDVTKISAETRETDQDSNFFHADFSHLDFDDAVYADNDIDINGQPLKPAVDPEPVVESSVASTKDEGINAAPSDKTDETATSSAESNDMANKSALNLAPSPTTPDSTDLKEETAVSPAATTDIPESPAVQKLQTSVSFKVVGMTFEDSAKGVEISIFSEDEDVVPERPRNSFRKIKKKLRKLIRCKR